nr:MAG: tail-collar fiber protein [Bacteriophage sp.]
MSWEKSSYTTAGAAILSESLSGGALTITRAVSGTGIVETDLSAETTVSGETHELTILAIDTVKDGEETARKVSIQITGAESTYIMHQIGVYGRLNDDAEVLLFIMQDERGIEVPASSVNADFEIEIAALIAISNKAKIEIALSPQMQALMKLVKAEIEKHNAAADAHAATITAAVSAAVKNLSESGEILNEEQVKALIKEQVDGGTGGGYYGSYELTLAADGWKPARSEDDYENAGGMDYYQCIYDAELSDSTSELVPVGVVSPGSFYTTTKAGVLNGCETHDGFIRFFAQRIPEADIQATVTLFGKGGGSSETGSVSIGQGLKRDASGAIAVRIGEGLDFDSANALTVRKETVMTNEDLLNEEETQQEIVDMLK